MPTPDLTVIIPVRNGWPYIKPCLESILQNKDIDFEVCIVNDHSTDDTLSFLHSFCKKHPTFQWVDNMGTGIIDALHTGLQQAASPVITRMDADDLMPPYKLKYLWNALQKNKKGVAVGKVSYFSDNELGQGYVHYTDWLNALVENGNPYVDIYKECVIPSPNWMMYKDTLERVGGFGNQYPEDYDLAFRLFQFDIPVLTVKEVTHYWRDHPNRTSRTDPKYAANHFIPLKVLYFLKCSRRSALKLVLYGAGKKGKTVAIQLQKHQVSFEWFTDNPKKIGHTIYGVTLQAGHSAIFDTHQVILAVSQPQEKEALLERLNTQIPAENILNFF